MIQSLALSVAMLRIAIVKKVELYIAILRNLDIETRS
jgi:hypothetical protein